LRKGPEYPWSFETGTASAARDKNQATCLTLTRK
jgi:hypothetical protein